MDRPADYLPPGTVGQWLPVPCNGGPYARAATQKPTKQQRGLTHNSRAGIPNRLRLNCHQRSTLKPAWTASVRKGAGAQRPHCTKGRGPENPGVVAPFAFAGLCGNRSRTVLRRLMKFDLRPCPLRLRASLFCGGACSSWTSFTRPLCGCSSTRWSMSLLCCAMGSRRFSQ